MTWADRLRKVFGRNAGTADGREPVPASVPASLRDLHVEAMEIGQESVIFPVRIFALARRFADHPDTAEALAYLDRHAFNHPTAFVRRVAFTAVRFLAQGARDAAPAIVDRRIITGMADENAWVRYDAAWCAGLIRGNEDANRVVLADLVTAEAACPEAADPSSSSGQALERARKSLNALA